MRECFQFQGMSIWDHGVDVRVWYVQIEDLIFDGVGREDLPTRLPAWIRHPRIIAHFQDADDEVIRQYQFYHDCGKPLCRNVDEEGRQHFPDHAAVSKARWLECGGSFEVGELIGMDMDVHTVRGDAIEEFISRPQALTLLLTGLAEVHSNAQMFGGIDSVGFKIKYKQIDRIGKRMFHE